LKQSHLLDDDDMKLMPTIFIGHGSPMNALEESAWTKHLTQLGETIPRPRAIVMVSAHWTTSSTKHLYVEKPRTIHDFYGFPEKLYQVQYPAPGFKMKPNVWSSSDDQWGFDHGTWSVLKYLYPKADIPVTQISLSTRLNMKEHMALGAHLRQLRQEEILVLGSGNITHNLRDLDFTPNTKPREWAVEFDERTKEALINRDVAWLRNEKPQYQKLWQQAHPTPEHYLPLLYVFGSTKDDEQLSFPFEQIQAGSLSMRTVQYS
jgi:4,5-DOPA dioxygenase extradiol